MSVQENIKDSYYLQTDSVGLVSSVEISLEKYKSLKRSQEVLFAALSIEEKYELLVGNYIALELVLVEISVQNMSRNKFSVGDNYYADAFRERMSINRHIINFLTSVKMYMDQTVRDIRTCNESDELAKGYFKAITSQQYDQYFEYRFMEQLRNHVQHYDFPANSVTSTTQVKQDREGCTWHFLTTVSSLKTVLAKNKKFKKEVLNEIPEKVELGSAIRIYLASISDIQEKVRQVISNYVLAARSEVESAFANFPDLNAKVDSLLVFHRQESSISSAEVECFSVMLMHDDVRIFLQNQNLPMHNLSRRTAMSNYQ